MARKKSVEDIQRQAIRIASIITKVAERTGGVSGNHITTPRLVARYQKAFAIAKRYADNIRKTRSFKRTTEKIRNAETLRETNRLWNKRDNLTKYSSSTYMGLNQG